MIWFFSQQLKAWTNGIALEYNSDIFASFHYFGTGLKFEKKIKSLSDWVFHFLRTHAMHLLNFLDDPNLQWKVTKNTQAALKSSQGY